MNNGKLLKMKRQLIGLTTVELGKRVGVTKQTISNIENGKTESIPVIRMVEFELAKAFIEWDPANY